MTTIDTLMALADVYAMPNGGVRTYYQRDEARAALRAALTEALAAAPDVKERI